MLAPNHFGLGVMSMGMRVRVGQTNAAILRGELDLSTWSEEELIRGQRRASNGRFQGRPPTVVPKAVHDELVRRKMSEAHDLLRDNVVRATEVLVEIATDGQADAAVRLKAATTILDRVLGKAPERVEVAVEPPWARAIRHAIAPLGPIAPPHAIDAESWEDDEQTG